MSARACPPCEDPLDLELEWKLLDELPVVDTVTQDVVHDRARKTQHNRVICSLWCGANHLAGDLRQPSVKCNQSTVPDIEHAVRALRLKIENAHAGCLAAAEAARAAANGPATRPPPNAIAGMMATAAARRLDTQAAAAEARAEAARKEAATLRAAADAAWEPLQEAARAKRQRVDGADLGFWKPWLEATPPSVATWDLKQWRDQEDEEQKRRDVKIGAAAGHEAGQEPLAPRTGKDGYLHHWRRGLLGAVRSWARGVKAHVVTMVMGLISSENGFGIEAEVSERLADAIQAREAETNALIVDRAVAVLMRLKACDTEQARREYHIVLGALAPPLLAERAAMGMARRVAARLRVRRGRRARTAKQKANGEKGRPFAF